VSGIGVPFVYEDPKEKDMAPEQKSWLKGWVSAIENVLFGTNFLDPTFGYSRYVDVDSFIDYHWMVEVTKNIDGYWFSQFYHIDRGGKLKAGPIWDYDLSFGNVLYHEGYRTNGWRWEKSRGPNLQSFGDHGVTQAKLTALKQRLKTYDGLRVMLRQAKAAAAAATRQLEQLFPEADRLLANRVDRLVWQFRESAPEFYEKYQVARTIVDATTSTAETPSVASVPNSKAA
jgi:hypothetical protein